MREYILTRKPVGLEHFGARGWVKTDDDSGEYELEVGAKMDCSPEMLALCVHYDEVMELLREVPSPLAAMTVRSIEHTVHTIYKQWTKDADREEERLNATTNASV